MARLRYVGPPPVAANDKVPLQYVTDVKAQDLSAGAIDTQINSGIAPYADKSYVDSRDALLADKAFIDAGDATRLKLAQKNVVNGVAGLGANNKVEPIFINLPNNQRWPRAFWSPPDNGDEVSVSTNSEATILTCPITDPGYPYRIAVFGNMTCSTSVNGVYPVVNVRVGSVGGPIIASGTGLAETYLTSTGLTSGDDFERTVTDGSIAPGWLVTYDSDRGQLHLNGHEAVWVTSAGSNGEGFQNHVVAQRISPVDRYTLTDDQAVTMFISQGLEEPGLFGTESSNSVMMRCSDDGKSYIKGIVDADSVYFRYTLNGRDGETTLGSIRNMSGTRDDNTTWQFTCQDRVYRILKNGVQVHEVVETVPVSNKGPDYRGWGFQMHIGSQFFSQTQPGRMEWITIEDFERLTNTTDVVLAPRNLHSQSAITGPTTLYVRLAKSSTVAATVTANPFRRSLWVAAIPA